MALVTLIAGLAAGCSGGAPPQAGIHRGQVFDQETEKPIAGVIVVGIYRGSRGFEGASSCNRVESTVSDENGWFSLPLDPEAGPLWLEGYHKDYRYGFPLRYPDCGIDGDPNRCDISIQRRDENDNVIAVVREPAIYGSREEATKAARLFQDLYLRRFSGDRQKRISVLRQLEGATSCGGPPKTSEGVVPLLEAILKEQIELGDSADAIRITNEYLGWARDAALRKK